MNSLSFARYFQIYNSAGGPRSNPDFQRWKTEGRLLRGGKIAGLPTWLWSATYHAQQVHLQRDYLLAY